MDIADDQRQQDANLIPDPMMASNFSATVDRLGYGARIAYGCNIGAFFSGVASDSLHGWVWFAAAFVGNVAGTRMRPLFGLRVERRTLS